MARQVVPAYVEIDGQWVQVGTAAVDITMGAADITINDDAPVGRALAAMMAARVASGFSIGFPTQINPEDLEFETNKFAYIREEVPGDRPAPKSKTPIKDLYKDVEPGTEIHNVPTHTHNPVQHRDGKSPWCNVCGLTDQFFVPLPAFTKNRGQRADRVIVDEVPDFERFESRRFPGPPPNLHVVKTPEQFTD